MRASEFLIYEEFRWSKQRPGLQSRGISHIFLRRVSRVVAHPGLSYSSANMIGRSDRQKRNLEILEIIKTVILHQPDWRFQQILSNLGIVEDSKDKFFEESIETLLNLKDNFLAKSIRTDMTDLKDCPVGEDIKELLKETGWTDVQSHIYERDGRYLTMRGLVGKDTPNLYDILVWLYWKGIDFSTEKLEETWCLTGLGDTGVYDSRVSALENGIRIALEYLKNRKEN